MKESLIRELEAIVGSENVHNDQETLIAYSYDATRWKALPEVVVKPRETEEVAKIVKLAYENSIPVTPRGAGTGLSGGSIPQAGGIVLSTERMCAPPQFHKNDLYAVVRPGVVTEHFQKQAESMGLFYPPDPASQAACTIGGNIGECAGGLRAIKYGTTRHYVLGLEVVTPEGKVIRTGARTVKSVAGYDLTRLMVGSEGTLGIVTSANLRLLPLPPARRALIARFDDIVTASEAASAIIAERLLPCTLEIMDSQATKAVAEYIGEDLGAGSILLVEFDGTKSLCQEDASKASGILQERFECDVELELEPQDREKLWRARREVLPALTRLRPIVLLEDVTVARSKLPEMVDAINLIAQKYEVEVAIFGHAGDGNLHPAYLIEDNRDALKRAKVAIAETMRACLDLDGTISGEHGIGVEKMPYLKLELGRAGYEVMKAVKNAFDPHGIMNPGKMFYEE